MKCRLFYEENVYRCNLLKYIVLLVLRLYSPVNPMGSYRAQSVCLITLLSSKRLTSIVHILSPET